MRDIVHFVSGFKRFQEKWFGEDGELFSQLKQGQSPPMMLIGCSDSRVDPAILTDAAPGDIFMVRNVANLVPPCEPDAHYHGVSAALEYGVCHLNVQHIVVLGHSQCGGIKGLMDGIADSDATMFIGKWVGIAQKAKEKVESELAEKTTELKACACERASVLNSLENLMTYPWIRERVEKGSLLLHGWYFDLQTGQLLGYSTDSNQFDTIS